MCKDDEELFDQLSNIVVHHVVGCLMINISPFISLKHFNGQDELILFTSK